MVGCIQERAARVALAGHTLGEDLRGFDRANWRGSKLTRDDCKWHLANIVSEREEAPLRQVGHLKQRDVIAREVGERVVLMVLIKGLEVNCTCGKRTIAMANAKTRSVQREICVVGHAMARREYPLRRNHAAQARRRIIDVDVNDGGCFVR